MADPYAPNDDWQEGYDAGYDTGYFEGMKRGREQRMNRATSRSASRVMNNPFVVKPKQKRPQKGKAKLLTTMTKKKWDKYKRGNGKKTYVEIRAQVSKTQDYKRACKRKGFK